MLYVFLLKPFKQWNSEKLQLILLAKFLHKKHSCFNGSFSFLNFSLDFYFASFPSLKALTGCLEKLEGLAKRFDL